MGRPCKECGAKIGHLEHRETCKLCEIEKPLRDKIRILEKALELSCKEYGFAKEDYFVLIRYAEKELKKEK
ncbi:MAG: hypothetical protein KAS04_04100 [Candidatus Aenigmarchaeota archaeon]|nr:hypothetical protein [Candidatus Aenigmarchaeota archaeon]